jgi:hypothetical protein
MPHSKSSAVKSKTPAENLCIGAASKKGNGRRIKSIFAAIANVIVAVI